MTVWNLLQLALLLALILLGLSRLFRRITVFEYQHALRFVHGELVGTMPPGSYWYARTRTTVQVLEARPWTVTIPGQELLSSDGVSLKVSLLLEVRVVNPKTATLASASYQEALYAKAQAALRSAIGERPIEEILKTRGELSSRIRNEVEPEAKELGLELLALAIKDLMFPAALKEMFAQTARARQEGQALLERARGETAALRNLANASRLLATHPHLFQLRLLQTAAEGGKIVVNVVPPQEGPSGDHAAPRSEEEAGG